MVTARVSFILISLIFFSVSIDEEQGREIEENIKKGEFQQTKFKDNSLSLIVICVNRDSVSDKRGELYGISWRIEKVSLEGEKDVQNP